MEHAVGGRHVPATAPGKEKKRTFALFNVKVGGIDLTFLILVILLLTIGLIMLFSASYANAYYLYDNSFIFISKQLGWGLAGLVLMILISTIDYRVLYKMAWPIYLATVPLLIAVYFFEPLNGAKRWIHFGSFTFQPSELAKFAIVIVFARMAIVYQKQIRTFRYGIFPFLMALGVYAGLILPETHLSCTILILAMGAIMMIVGGSNLKWFALAAGVGAAGILLIVATGLIHYADARLVSWRDPFSDPQGVGFQVIQSLYAIGSGGLMGVGIGNSRQKFLYLPEPQNDFIFAIVCEELGFVGATLIIILFALLVWRGFVIAMRCKNKFGTMVAVGLTSQVGLQVILNIMVVTNTIPNTGISLPFFSAGGTALLLLLCQMGVLLSISRDTNLEKR